MKKKRIYISGRFLTQPISGVQRYAYELCMALRAINVSYVIIMPNTDIQDCYNVKGWDIIKWGHGNSHIWEQIILPLFFLFKKDYCLVSFTGLGPLLVRNKVMTIHDLAFFENPKWYSKPYVFYYKFMTPLCARTSKAILTVSEFSKGEITKWLHIANHKIHVIYNSATNCNVNERSMPADIPEKFFLAVSSIDPRKNFERLVNVFGRLPDCNLVVVGGSSRVFSKTALGYECKNVKFLGRVSDDTLVCLYKHAFAFLYPSLYEGFGIPPLEAMTYGCPVVASDIEVLREVCGEAALYADPFSEKEIENKIMSLYKSENLRNELSEKGKENVKRFSWVQSATKLSRLLQQL